MLLDKHTPKNLNRLAQMLERDADAEAVLELLTIVNPQLLGLQRALEDELGVIAGALLRYTNTAGEILIPNTPEEFFSSLLDDERAWLENYASFLNMQKFEESMAIMRDRPNVLSHYGNPEYLFPLVAFSLAIYRRVWGMVVRDMLSPEGRRPATSMDYSMLSLILGFCIAKNNKPSYEKLRGDRASLERAVVDNGGIAFDLSAIDKLPGKNIVDLDYGLLPNYTFKEGVTVFNVGKPWRASDPRGTIVEVLIAPLLPEFPLEDATSGTKFGSDVVVLTDGR